MPLLVIRGLNPQENVINSLDVKDFFAQVVAYLKPIAEKQGRKLAIVIDGASGCAATNRPVLFKHLEEQKSTLKPVILKPNKNTDFNGYNITHTCFLLK